MIDSLRPRLRRGRKTLVLAAGLAVAATFVVPGVAGAAWVGRPYYVDCAAGNDSATALTPQTAWRTLAKASSVTLTPADSILLKSGTTCKGTLAPKGSGASGANGAVKIDSYGAGAGRPAIVAEGARAAVFLNNVNWYEIRNLDLSNTAPRDAKARAGIYVLLTDFGRGSHYVVEGVSVHDVTGCDCTGPNSDTSGGIVFAARGSVTQTGFDDIRVANNTVTNVDGYGIATTSNWDRRDRHPSGTNPYVPITRVYIGGNTLGNLGGDGIVVQNGVSSLVENNKVDGFGLRATVYHVGIYSWNSDHAVVQGNEVARGASTPPAPAYGNDASNLDLTIQYNYSHDNGGGFLFFCSDDGDRSDMVTARYNISQNDRNAHFGTFTTPLIGECLGNMTMDAKVYNNTVYSPNATAMVYMFGQSSLTFTNNIFSGSTTGATITDPVGVYDHNLYANNIVPPAGDKGAVRADPRFTNPGDINGYCMFCGSPAINAGAVIPSNGGRDYYGYAVPSGTPPNIGAYGGPCITSR